MRLKNRFFLLSASTLSLLSLSAFAQESLDSRARAILDQKCVECHKVGGSAERYFGDIRNIEKLIAESIVVPGDPAQSSLIEKVESGEMPLKRPPLSGPEIQVLRDWIRAMQTSAAQSQNRYIGRDEVLQWIAADTRDLDDDEKREWRYFSLVPLWNSGADTATIDMHRRATIRLLHGLHWQERGKVLVEDVSGVGLLLKVNVDDLEWDKTALNALDFGNPFRDEFRGDAGYSSVFGEQAAYLPSLVFHADWFVATASFGKTYYDLLKLPSTIRELEGLLDVNAAKNVADGEVVRAGARESGVSHNNRVVEGHRSKYGAYWVSRDFADELGKSYIDKHPIDFVAAGGEVIFHLPNGMLAYFLFQADNGKRLDAAPQKIVVDPRTPDHSVLNASSCMRCHAEGYLDYVDTVRRNVELSKVGFSAEEKALVRKLYPPREQFQAVINRDNGIYTAALESFGDKPLGDPTTPVIERFREDLGRVQVAAEVYMTSEELQALLTGKTAALLVDLQALAVDGAGTVPREVFLQNASALARARAVVSGNPYFANNDRKVEPITGIDFTKPKSNLAKFFETAPTAPTNTVDATAAFIEKIDDPNDSLASTLLFTGEALRRRFGDKEIGRLQGVFKGQELQALSPVELFTDGTYPHDRQDAVKIYAIDLQSRPDVYFPNDAQKIWRPAGRLILECESQPLNAFLRRGPQEPEPQCLVADFQDVGVNPHGLCQLRYRRVATEVVTKLGTIRKFVARFGHIAPGETHTVLADPVTAVTSEDVCIGAARRIAERGADTFDLINDEEGTEQWVGHSGGYYAAFRPQSVEWIFVDINLAQVLETRGEELFTPNIYYRY